MRPLLEIDPATIRRNFTLLRERIGASLGIAVVKDGGYGLGVEGVVVAFQDAPEEIHAFAVATLEEAEALREQGVSPERILVLYAPADPVEIRELLASPFQVAVGSRRILDLLGTSPRSGLHLHVDIGMHRMGLSEDRARTVLEGYPWAGLMLHFPLTPREDPEGYALLVERARRWIRWFREAHPHGVIHVANTALSLAGEGWLQGTLPRVGLGLWGLAPEPSLADGLVPAFRLKAPVVEIKDVPAGAGISYGWRYRTARPSRIGVVAVGYADGLPRALSGRGWVVYAGRRFSMVGAVTMDLVMVDFTEGPVPEVGEEVVLLGEAPAMSPYDWAGMSGTIVYEVLTGLGKRALRRLMPVQGITTFRTL